MITLFNYYSHTLLHDVWDINTTIKLQIISLTNKIPTLFQVYFYCINTVILKRATNYLSLPIFVIIYILI